MEFGIRNLESEKTGNLLVIAHVHHIGFRDESEEDKRFVEKYCDEHALFLETMTLDADEVSKKHKTSPENACRIERRDFFETLREKYGAKYILTGHHLDDQIETMMYRLIRGAKIHGLCGIQEREGNYLRPLLGVKKSDILSWLSDNKIPFCQDSSNEDDTYPVSYTHLTLPTSG